MLAHDAIETFLRAFELRTGVKRGTKIVKRLGLLADGLVSLGPSRQGDWVARSFLQRFAEVADRLLVLAKGEVKAAAIEVAISELGIVVDGESTSASS